MLGHSEDIKYNNLSIENINNQIQKAIENNLKIVLCFGDETYESNIVKRLQIRWSKFRVKKLTLKNKSKEKIQGLTEKINILQSKIEEANRKRDERRKEPYKIILD